MNGNLKKFLEESEYCDFKHPMIKNKAREITKDCIDDREKAVALFYWVRDNILYRVGLWKRESSKTLVEKEGTCTNKSNLLVALLRSVGILSGYGVMKVYGQEYFGPIAIPMLRCMVSERSVHVYTVAYLNNKWVKCDPSDDILLSRNTAHFNPTTILVDWDGSHDAMLNLDDRHVIEDNYPISSIDYLMDKKPRKGRGIPVKVGNIFIRYLRDNKFNNLNDLEQNFKVYLRRHYFLCYCVILLLKFFRELINYTKKDAKVT